MKKKNRSIVKKLEKARREANKERRKEELKNNIVSKEQNQETPIQQKKVVIGQDQILYSENGMQYELNLEEIATSIEQKLEENKARKIEVVEEKTEENQSKEAKSKEQEISETIEQEQIKEEKKQITEQEQIKQEEEQIAEQEQVKEEEKQITEQEQIQEEKKQTEEQLRERRLEEFETRFSWYYDELKWLYTELYGQTAYLDELKNGMRGFFLDREESLVQRDKERETYPDWLEKSNIIGMMMYVDLFSGNLKGFEEKIDYLKELNISYVHLMPLLKMPKEQNDGGYAVSDFRMIDERLGTMEEFEQLTRTCHKNEINVCIDFVLNHTSDEHEWAKKAKNGEWDYMEYYMCFDNDDIPKKYDETIPPVFPNTAPGNFIWNEQMQRFVFSGFHPYQWDLNYKNPVVFNQMVYHLLYLANKGVDIFRMDAVPYIWKELGTKCRNLKQVHSIVRMMRIVCKVVCPSVVFKGEVVMEPHEIAPYFGTPEKPECDMLYNVTTMVCIWNSLATKDTRLLKWQLDTICSLPKNSKFVNYVRCHDDIGWGLDEASLRYQGFDPLEHKKFLYHFYEGSFPCSFSRGELYNYDAATQDARSCGTSASLCGIEEAIELEDEKALSIAIQRDLMIHSFMLSLSGIPILYSGDEIGALNDYSYKEDAKKADDSRYLHRSPFSWENCEKRKEEGSIQNRIFENLKKMIQLRSQSEVFDADAHVIPLEFTDYSLIGIKREKNGKKVVCFFNFSEYEKDIYLENGMYQDMLNTDRIVTDSMTLKPYEYVWFVQK